MIPPDLIGVDHPLAKHGEEGIGIKCGDLCRSEMRHTGKSHRDLLMCMHAEPLSESETSCVSYITLFNRILEYIAFVKSSAER